MCSQCLTITTLLQMSNERRVALVEGIAFYFTPLRRFIGEFIVVYERGIDIQVWLGVNVKASVSSTAASA